MPGLLRIECRYQDNIIGSSFNLRDLVALISTEGERLVWRAFPMLESMELTGDLSVLDTSVNEFEQRVNTSEAGVVVNWDDLIALSRAIEHTHWAMFLGCESVDSFAGLRFEFLDEWNYVDRATPEFYRRVTVGFQAIDGWLWNVYVKDDTVLERILSAFKDVEFVRRW